MTRNSAFLSESIRDQDESSFTQVLRWLFESEPHIAAVLFVDQEGECVDYCSALDPFDTKVTGAQLQTVINNLKEIFHRMAIGEVLSLLICGTERDLIVRRIDEVYTLIIITRSGMADDSIMRGVELLVDKIREHARLSLPSWEQPGKGLEVRVRTAVGWGFAPEAVGRVGYMTPIVSVLGRWEEDGGFAGGKLICFRVRTGDQAEMTLAHDLRTDRWFQI